MQPVIINAALTGMVPQRKDSPHIPLTPDEIVVDARRCVDAGASILHLHARDAHGAPTYRAEVFAEIIAGVREACPEALISASCSGRVHNEFWQRSAVLDLAPDFASLTLGSLNFPTQPAINSPEMIQSLATAMNERDIIPEWELFDLGMAEYAHYLIRKGFLRPPFYANLLLGSLGALSATPENLCRMVAALPAGTTWSATGIGRFQWQVHCLALAMGGHLRIGLEDALYYDWQTKALATNAGLIDRAVRVARGMGREIATPAQTRALIGISPVVPNVIPFRKAA